MCKVGLSHSDHITEPKTVACAQSLLHDDAAEAMSDSVTTTSDGGSSIMTHGSFDEDVCSSKAAVCDSSESRFTVKHETLLIFDYDDTLFPTSFLASRGYRLDGPDASADIQRLLDEYADVVETSLLQARELGHVVILTNAETGWIELTSQKFMPRLSELLESFPLVSARSTYEPLGISSPFQWKLRAFESVINEHYDRVRSFSCRNVLSFGDSIHERDAAHQVCANLPQSVCKSIKFMERPDVAQLTKQHSLIRDCFEQIVHHQGTLDLCIQCQQPGEEP